MRLSAHDLWFGYDDRPILDGVEFSAATGEAVAIVGPSGVGKTTLLSLLGGMQRPRAGRVEVDGDPAVSAHVSWVLQTVNVLANRSVLENVALGPLVDGRPRREALAIAASRLHEVGLDALADAPARKVSGGELQRVVIARALASSRPFLLADEPTGQLDRVTTDQIVECLLLARAERGLIVVTHDPAVAARCDRRYELVDGLLREPEVAA